MERIAIILLLLTAGCMSTVQTDNSSQEYIRPALQANVEVGIVNSTTKETGVIFTISDFEKMARTSMNEGKTLELPTTPPAIITMNEIGADYVIVTINGDTKRVSEQTNTVFEDGALQLYIARII